MTRRSAVVLAAYLGTLALGFAALVHGVIGL